ncbi:MAG: alpha-L-fucosidase, partial [Bacteroidetes bacterium]|nr:alpha-L-fucosidase [Bacteroidota bacterium]
KALDWNKEVVINYKYDSYPDGVAVLDLERGKLDSVRKQPWQTDDALGNQSWGYTTTNTFKDARYVVTNLVDIVSKNGNLLLNIGPKSDGTITDQETQVLLGVGKWLAINGDAIYATRPWKVYGEGPTKSASGSFADQKVPFTWRDVRFTTKGDTLYIIALGLPNNSLNIKSLSANSGHGKVASIKMLGSSEKVNWVQKPGALVIDPLKSYPSEYAVSYAVTFAH